MKSSFALVLVATFVGTFSVEASLKMKAMGKKRTGRQGTKFLFEKHLFEIQFVRKVISFEPTVEVPR